MSSCPLLPTMLCILNDVISGKIGWLWTEWYEFNTHKRNHGRLHIPQPWHPYGELIPSSEVAPWSQAAPAIRFSSVWLSVAGANLGEGNCEEIVGCLWETRHWAACFYYLLFMLRWFALHGVKLNQLHSCYRNISSLRKIICSCLFVESLSFLSRSYSQPFLSPNEHPTNKLI